MLIHTPTDKELCPWAVQARDAILALPMSTSQRDVAAATGIPEAWLSKFLNGKIKSPDINYIYKLHTVYVRATNV